MTRLEGDCHGNNVCKKHTESSSIAKGARGGGQIPPLIVKSLVSETRKSPRS